MGRARSNVDFIKNEKVRVTTYHRRKKSLIKKATQLATLCDIQVCIIMSGPKLSDNAPKPLEAWSENPKEPSLVIQNFKNAIKNKKHRDLTVSDVLSKKTKKPANDDNNDDDRMSNFRFWHERAGELSLPQLEELLESIAAKLRHISVIEEDRRVHFVNFMFPNGFEASPYTYDQNADAIREDRRVGSGNFNFPYKLEAGPSGNFNFPYKLEAGPYIYDHNANAIREDRRASSGNNFNFPYKLEGYPITHGNNASAIRENREVNLGNFAFPDEPEAGPGTFDPNFISHHPYAHQIPPPRPHDHSSNPTGRFTNAMTSDNSDFSSRFANRGVSFNDEASSSVYMPNFLDLSFGLASNNINDDDQAVQNPNAPIMWYLSTEQFEDSKREAKFGGFNG